MKGSFNVIGILLTTLFITSCAEIDKNAAQTVRVSAKASNCTYVGQVSSAERLHGASQMLSNERSAQERHLNNLKVNAYDLGANTIVLQSYDTKFRKEKTSSASIHSMTAGAYRCPN